MNFKKPLIVISTERIVHEMCKSYPCIKSGAMWLILEDVISNGKVIFKNRIKKPVTLTFENELLTAEDESLGIYRAFNLPSEYSTFTHIPTLLDYLTVDESKYTTLNKPLAKHRSISPATLDILLLDIETYFEINPILIISSLKELLIKNTSVINNKVENHALMKIKNAIEFQVDDLTYPAITVTKIGIRPRRKFTRYILNKYLIKYIMKL